MASKNINEYLFNPASPAFLNDPYRFYEVLRRQAPFYRSPMGFVVVSRDRDVRAILADKRFGRDFQRSITHPESDNRMFREPAMQSMRHWMLVLDPPDHPRIRSLVARAFTPRSAAESRALVQSIVDQALDRLAGRQQADIINEFAYVVPQRVICALLGIPEEDQPGFLANVTALLPLLDPVPLTRVMMDRANAQTLALGTYFRRLFERRRQEPISDLTTRLVQAEEVEEQLSEEELTANMMLIFVAGFETTANMIGNGLLALLRHPEQVARLKADPSLMPGAVEEFLRYDSSVQFTTRAAMENLKLGEVQFRKGEPVVVLLASANRDPEAYEQPDRFDIMRKNIRPLSFGGGIHHCLGNQLARLEAELAIGGLLKRFPGIRLADNMPLQYRPTITLRGLKALPVAL